MTSESTLTADATLERPVAPMLPSAEGQALNLPQVPLVAQRAPSGSFRQTKIIATLGPATEDGDVLRSILEAGVSVFRVNLACITRASALKAVYAIRSISTELQRPVSLLLEAQPSPRPTADSSAISESDWDTIRFGIECGVDWMVVASGRDGEAVRQLRQFLADQKRTNISILARIEGRPSAAALHQIIQTADGILLDRHSCDAELPDGQGPNHRHRAIQQSANARKPVIITTRIPETAIHDATVRLPEMAATMWAVHEQPDALLLGGETSTGALPLQSVQSLDRLIRQEESNGPRLMAPGVALETGQDHAVATAVRQADEMKADAIVIFTRSGNSASLCAALRPRQSRVFVFTPDARLARRLRLHYALETIALPFSAQPKATLRAAEKVLRERQFLRPGAQVVFVTDLIDQEQRTSSVQMRTLA